MSRAQDVSRAEGVSRAQDVAALLARLRAAGQTLAVAESLTGGLVAAAITAVPGASDVFRGGVVAYATELKHELLGVDPKRLVESGPVDAEVACQLAAGARERLGATWGLSTTGVAGPDPQAGHAPGLVFVAVSGPTGTRAERLLLQGDRSRIRTATVAAALGLLDDSLEDAPIPRQNDD